MHPDWQWRVVALAMMVGLAAAAPGRAAEEKASEKKEADEKKADVQKEEHFEREIKMTITTNYLLYLPPGYGTQKKSWPLVLFLHGSGESGNDLSKVKFHGPPKQVAAGRKFPFILVSPQAPLSGWDLQTLNALIDDLIEKFNVDKDRIYLTGLSMGGYGTWSLASESPDRFAAIAPICGGGVPEDAQKLKDLPIWVFHGAKDDVVPLKSSEEMVDALRKLGSKKVKFTVYPDAGHDSWSATYDNPEFYEWLLKQRRGEAQP